ncbi:2-amino-4-hydroxy-6-hydroxymethyldihydropteridine diphosphokinase [Salinibacterium xinjiangense]|uniref:2-amino-4-hydroxy-6-hydroxymethyldihydropteridine diphosphokinase n=1 Tax=Salinibacterium xinjiangense TaxID=386302 RepID=A0A2C8Z522_9MICO|nr:2-amino-4-hydroxy-6-hydroxymethyldihydropteridine diphosphokinase [Salinibacterium xinjiangense]GGK93534.1 2-amino-4-hydroxy-6-hydroxymethyldihydropteridine diphosphokinase [Salinibacterium xinjiangense]SOE58674.1 2-amino-4-hydroxy-6-hydroxymethyldihydropteridinediphosphokinase [Salinibacterium xinjiangense]
MAVNLAILAIGSNLGDREQALRAAVREIAALDRVVMVAASGIVETAAVKPDGVDLAAPAYLNAAVAVRTSLAPLELLAAVNAIEAELGRVRGVRWGDRIIDIDIISFADLELDSPTLTIPHPRAAERSFVLTPWLQLDEDAAIPGRGRVADLLAELDTPAEYPAEPLL